MSFAWNRVSIILTNNPESNVCVTLIEAFVGPFDLLLQDIKAQLLIIERATNSIALNVIGVLSVSMHLSIKAHLQQMSIKSVCFRFTRRPRFFSMQDTMLLYFSSACFHLRRTIRIVATETQGFRNNWGIIELQRQRQGQRQGQRNVLRDSFKYRCVDFFKITTLLTVDSLRSLP